jgi:hypothetical protein
VEILLSSPTALALLSGVLALFSSCFKSFKTAHAPNVLSGVIIVVALLLAAVPPAPSCVPSPVVSGELETSMATHFCGIHSACRDFNDVPGTAIYSNSSNRGVFSHAFHNGRARVHNGHMEELGQPVSFFASRAKNSEADAASTCSGKTWRRTRPMSRTQARRVTGQKGKFGRGHHSAHCDAALQAVKTAVR